ncbi:MAG: hypothetical protein ACQERC_00385 [Bacteroidota bacterium]
MNKENKSLLFVYNADSGLWIGALDAMHKVFSPKTYACNLCGITYGTLAVKKDWTTFIKKLPLKTEFLHRDEFQTKFDRQDALPAVFVEEENLLHSLIPSSEMNQLNLESLKRLILARIEV